MISRRLATVETPVAIDSIVATRRNKSFGRMQAINDLPKIICRYAAEQLRTFIPWAAIDTFKLHGEVLIGVADSFHCLA
jgi:hypothetical protein